MHLSLHSQADEDELGLDDDELDVCPPLEEDEVVVDELGNDKLDDELVCALLEDGSLEEEEV